MGTQKLIPLKSGAHLKCFSLRELNCCHQGLILCPWMQCPCPHVQHYRVGLYLPRGCCRLRPAMGNSALVGIPAVTQLLLYQPCCTPSRSKLLRFPNSRRTPEKLSAELALCPFAQTAFLYGVCDARNLRAPVLLR